MANRENSLGRRIVRWAGAAAASVAIVLGGAVVPAAAAPDGPIIGPAPAPTGCSFGTATGGIYKDSICWLDMSSYDSALAQGDGQRMIVDLGSGYTINFTLRQRGNRGVTPSVLPGPGFGNDIYGGIAGLPALYTTTGSNFGRVSLILEDISVTGPGGVPASGFAFVGADAETLDAYQGPLGETVEWSSDKTIEVIDRSSFGTGGCPIPTPGDGTTLVTCRGASPGEPAALGTVVRAVAPTYFQQNIELQGAGERQAVAFGVQVARVTLVKNVAGRTNATDSFYTSISAGDGTLLADASTGLSNTSSTSALVIPAEDGTDGFVLSEEADSGDLGTYQATWACTNAVRSTTSPFEQASASSITVNPQPGDNITCTVTNTPARYDVTKTVDTEETSDGQVVTYAVTITNTGTAAFTDASPASILDDLSDVLDDSTYNNDATGGAIVDGTSLSWSGALEPGESSTITYSVTTTGTGNRVLNNIVNPASASGVCVSAELCRTRTTMPAPAVGPVVNTGGSVDTNQSALPAIGGAAALLVIGFSAFLVVHRRRFS